jgi:hypothetical protein
VGGLAGKRLTVALFATARHFFLWRAVPIFPELLKNHGQMNNTVEIRCCLRDQDFWIEFPRSLLNSGCYTEAGAFAGF